MFAARYRYPSVTIGHWPTFAYLPFRLPFVLDEKKLNTHCRVHGISGSGKSKHLAHRTASLILQGAAVMLLDPHQDLADDVLLLLYQQGFFKSEKAYEKLLYIDFSNKTRFLPFNFLVQPYDMFTIARNMVEVCTRVWPNLGDGGGPLFEEIMLASVVVLVANNLPLTALPDLLTDKPYRDDLLSRPGVSYQAVRFFTKEFDHWRDQAQMIGSTMRRVFTLTFGPTLLNTLGQKENTLNFRLLVDNSVSVIVNLHGLDEETQKLLGCLVTVGMEQAALSRTTIRTPYYLIIDEFASFSTKNGEAYSKFLSQARKFQVFLIISHQTNSQLVKGDDDSLLKAIGNIKLEVHFQMSHDDALYEAPRLFEHNPYRKKAEVEDQELKEKKIPLYFPLQEHTDEKAWALKYLWPQQAYVKFTRSVPWFLRPFFRAIKTRKIKTVTVKIAKNQKALAHLKNVYATYYMRTEQEIQQGLKEKRSTKSLQSEQFISRRSPVSVSLSDKYDRN